MLEEQRTLEEPAQTPLHRGTRCLIIVSYTQIPNGNTLGYNT
jgi:hypothetical protein